jgi:hypothetical protein
MCQPPKQRLAGPDDSRSPLLSERDALNALGRMLLRDGFEVRFAGARAPVSQEQA